MSARVIRTRFSPSPTVAAARRVPEARDFYRRALAHRAAGRLAAAQRDLAAALALDPSDPALDAAALVWADDETRLSAAARAVDRSGASWAMRRKALAALIEAGSRITHRLRRGPRGVAGWIAWTGGGPLDIEATDDGGTRSLRLDPDPDHPLAQSDLAAAEVAIETHDSGRVALALKTQDGFALRLDPRFEARPRPRAAAAPAPRDAAPPFLTVIVPVYEDFAATRGCLEALAAAPPACAHEIVVVDDASPNAALKDWLDQAAASGPFRLIRNDSNLGFAAAVNRALARRERGDALLLNADALPPPGAIDRLAALSRAAPDIGTLTPFSNNGELLSYPIRNAANPLPSAAEIAALDALARENNGDALVDIPNGVGFCLYITEPCLDAVGGLPEIYAAGLFRRRRFLPHRPRARVPQRCGAWCFRRPRRLEILRCAQASAGDAQPAADRSPVPRLPAGDGGLRRARPAPRLPRRARPRRAAAGAGDPRRLRPQRRRRARAAARRSARRGEPRSESADADRRRPRPAFVVGGRRRRAAIARVRQ